MNMSDTLLPAGQLLSHGELKEAQGGTGNNPWGDPETSPGLFKRVSVSHRRWEDQP